MSRITLREARFDERDLLGIWHLCKQHFQKYEACTFDEFQNFCRGVWLNNPARTPEHGWVLENPSGEIGGFQGLIPIKMKVGDREVCAGAGHSWVVSPECRVHSLLLFKKVLSWSDRHFLLITAAGEVVVAIGSKLNCGITKIPVRDFNQQFVWLIRPDVILQWALNWNGYTRLAKLVRFFPVAQMVTNFTRIPCAGRLGLRFRCPRLSVEQVSVFGDEFDELWESNKHSYGVTAVRDKASLNWRHLAAPSVTGRTVVFECRDEGKLCGFLALQHRIEGGRFPPGHYVVTDVFYDRRRQDVLYNLMNFAFDFSKARGGSIFQVSNMSQELAQALRSQQPYIRTLKIWLYWYKAPSAELAALCQREIWWPSGSDGESSI